MRLYLIGAGVIARTHAEAAAKLPVTAELRVADPSPAALEAFAERFPDALRFADAEAMLAAEPPREDDIVIVATPPFAHLEPVKLALRSGRHVLCEKPLAMNDAEAEEMLRVAGEYGRKLGCCSVRFKGMAHMEAVKRVLRSGALGDVYHATFAHKSERSRAGIEYQPASRWFLDKSKSGGGILIDWGPYDFATLIDVLDPAEIEFGGAWTRRPVTEADPAGVVFDVETHAGAYMTFRGAGEPVRVHYERASCAHGEACGRAEIEGTRGAVRWHPFDSKQPVYIRYDKGGSIVEEQVETGPRGDLTIFDNPLFHFWAELQNGESLSNTGRRAVDHFRCLSAFYACAETGHKQTVAIAGAKGERP
ncbi:Predicted dehydrogenase [Paenibacillus sp. UNC496MF]|uniref:Gfo/Idh/MocA family protein n=1 Tax=Paenibacillus sp. UNC496MF TaxID=1502753 RepID=UPI0008ED1612|nr:Gfo/Idh/MocA family oxidoreductase [Paenibacillus sp. UNC496MF]SFI85827.1 Predicted dehydrogenase [Paenibacillus sp. UNC496MF]